MIDLQEWAEYEREQLLNPGSIHPISIGKILFPGNYLKTRTVIHQICHLHYTIDKRCSELSKGKKVGIIDLTRGELGTRGTAETRDEEADNAAKILGVAFRENMELIGQ